MEHRGRTADNINSEEDCFQYHSVQAFYVMKHGESGKKSSVKMVFLLGRLNYLSRASALRAISFLSNPDIFPPTLL